MTEKKKLRPEVPEKPVNRKALRPRKNVSSVFALHIMVQ